MDPQEILPDKPSESTNILSSDVQKSPSNKTNNTLLIIGIIVGLFLLLVVILLIAILPKDQNNDNLIKVTPTSTVVTTDDVEVTNTVSITATDEPVTTSTALPTISPTISNFSAHPDWNVFDSRTAYIYGAKPEKGLLSEFHFRYPEGMSVRASYEVGNGGILVEVFEGDIATNAKSYYIRAPGYKLAGSDTLKSLTAMELQAHDCIPSINEWKDSVKHSYLKLGTYTWNKATVDVTYTCNDNNGGIFGPAEALGILSKKDQLVFALGIREPFSNNMLETLKTFEFIY